MLFKIINYKLIKQGQILNYFLLLFFFIFQTYPYSAHTQARLANTLISQQTPPPNQRGRNRGRERAPIRVEEVPRDDVYYAFQYEECVVRAREIPFVECPVHGDLPLEYIAPDTVSN